MNAKIDLKSTVIGLLAGILGVLALGAGSPSSQTGRYRVEGTTPYFLLVDTQTGQVWCGNFQTGLKATDADFFLPKGDK